MRHTAHFPLIASLALALGACATVPTPLQGEFASQSPPATGLADGALVRWGGEVLAVEPKAGATCFQILSRELNMDARPMHRDSSGGRFLACRQGFYDPAMFPEGREVTVVGNLSGAEPRKIGEYDVDLPRVAASEIDLWPEHYQQYGYYGGWYGPGWYGPGWGYYDPFWWGIYPTVIYVHHGGGGHHHH